MVENIWEECSTKSKSPLNMFTRYYAENQVHYLKPCSHSCLSNFIKGSQQINEADKQKNLSWCNCIWFFFFLLCTSKFITQCVCYRMCILLPFISCIFVTLYIYLLFTWICWINYRNGYLGLLLLKDTCCFSWIHGSLSKCSQHKFFL